MSSPAPQPSVFELGTDGPATIVVGVDGSDASLRAAAYAAGLARRQGSQLLAVYVRSPAPPLVGVGYPVNADFQLAQDENERRLHQLLQQARSRGLDGSLVVATGDPFTGLCREATRTRADAVVVGASTNPVHRLAGSLAVKLVRCRRWPVTVVP